MKILFWGTPAYALPSLNGLVDAGHDLVGVVSQPDRRRGRGGRRTASPVKTRALELGLPVFTPERIRTDLRIQQELADLDADLSVVVAFGQILPRDVLAQPPLGCWNGHASLLPRWRGAAPIQWALLSGDRRTGVGIMAMEEGLDTGPVLLERSLEIGLCENAHELAARLASLTSHLLVEALPRIAAVGPGEESQRLDRLAVRAQGSAGVTYARMLNKDDERIDWSSGGLSIHRQVMGLFPRAVCHWKGRRLKLLATEPLDPARSEGLSEGARHLLQRRLSQDHGLQTPAGTAPGTVMEIAPGLGLVVVCGDGVPLLIRRAQQEGRTACGDDALVQQLGSDSCQRLD